MLFSPEFDLTGLHIVAYFGINYETIHQQKKLKIIEDKHSSSVAYLKLVQSYLDREAY